jgi:hypothetical protein
VQLTFRAVVLVEIDFGRIAPWALAVVIDIAFRATLNRFYGFERILVAPFKIFHVVPVIPGLRAEDQWEVIDLELLVFWGV